ncbi:Fanconi anemia group A protein homolog [Thrips palmi]|uniref:Fanconi anemia group A protein homolog n=1 Tax=Thrips palmi TaxID=161013 RepID=A0A6P8ZYE3_THRPL|nr:Fanconi anemia group A protein homolog [Thrips palmi]
MTLRLTSMDDLSDFLTIRCKPRIPLDANDAWELLTQKLADLKERDSTFPEVSSADLLVCRCVNTLHDASRNSKRPFAVPSNDSLAACEAIIDDAKNLLSDNFLYKTDLAKALINIEVNIPLLLVWKLHNAEILQLSSYVCRKIGHGEEKLVSDAIIWFLSNSEDSPEYATVVKDTFASLLVASQSRSLNLQLATICASILKKCADDIVDLAMSLSLPEQCATSTSTESTIEFFDFSYLRSSDLWSCGGEAMEQFVCAHLLRLLGEQPSHFDQTLTGAVAMQEKCSLSSVGHFFKDLLSLIVSGLGAEKILNQLGVAVVRPTVNWKIIFSLIAVLLSEKPECCDDLRKLTDELIQVGLEGGRQTELSAGFLIARQCCSCDSNNFGSYSLWFSENFGPNSTTAKNTVQFQSLLQLLTTIVPVESAENLRVHINKVPQAPMSCHSLLHDYAVLARTRLADLNESAELTGLFADSSRDAVSGLDSKQRDIVRVLQHFQGNKEIMKPVLEASVLRRSYYRNVFLVELMRLPGSAEKEFTPEDFGLNRETRHEFIMALNKMGKIPEKMFKAYKGNRSPEGKGQRSNAESKEARKETKSDTDQPKKRKSLELKPKRLAQ